MVGAGRIGLVSPKRVFHRSPGEEIGGGGRRVFSFNDIPSITGLSRAEKIELFRGKRVFGRFDLNLKPKGGRLDTKRLREALPTIEEISDFGGILFVASHRSDPVDPKGKVDLAVSMRPVAELIREQFPCRKVLFIGDYVRLEQGKALTAVDFEMHLNALPAVEDGTIIVLENLRYYPESRGETEKLTRTIADHFEVYVDDAFGTVHRAHASMVVPRCLQQSFVGPLMRKEIENLRPILDPAQPFIGVLGGSKITSEEGKEGKIEILEGLLPRVHLFLIAGGMAQTFLCAAFGRNSLGSFKPSEKDLEAADRLLNAYKDKIVLPLDMVFVRGISTLNELLSASLTGGRLLTYFLRKMDVDDSEIPADAFPADIGPKTLDYFGEIIDSAKTIFANGPAGVYENPLTARGTKELVRRIDSVAMRGAYALGGGGDFLAAAKASNLSGALKLSTGGGALLSVIAKNGEVPAFTAFFD